MTHKHCPTRERLSDYLTGKLPKEEFMSLSNHLDQCGNCQATLRDLDGATDSLVGRLHGLVFQDVDASDPALGLLLTEAKAFVPSGRSEDVPDKKDPAEESGLGRLGRYRLIAELGGGGMGKVFRAEHIEMEMPVALKVIRPELLHDEAILARFRREIKAAGRLRHPNIVRATDAGQEGGVHFLAMELLEGIDLAKLVKKLGPLPIAEAGELVRQAALALQHAHDNGLIHRDVKPSNLMLTTEGQVKVLDLGLAHIQLDQSSGNRSTPTGQFLGTPDYVAPEQAQEAKTVDHRADVYSLGATLYHLLAGTPPFGRPELASPARKLSAILGQAPRPVCTLRPEVPAALVKVVDRLLAKDPAQRLGSAAEVATALEPFARGADLGRLLRPTGRAEGAGEAAKGAVDTVPYAQAHVETQTTKPNPASRSRAALVKIGVAGLVILLGSGILAVLAWPGPGKENAPTEGSPPPAGLVSVVPPSTQGETAKGQTDPSPSNDPPRAEKVPSKEKLARGQSEEKTAKGQSDLQALEKKALKVLETYCNRCHGSEGGEGGIKYILDVSKLIVRKKVVPGDPGKSRIFQRAVAGDMPPEGETPRPGKEDFGTLKSWIAALKPDAVVKVEPPSPPKKERTFISLADNIAAMRQHLEKTPRTSQPFQRYFTLTHLHNNPQVKDEELRYYQAALAKLLNSLSWKHAVVVPYPVDAAQTVFAVDIRKLDWDRKNLWGEIIQAYPYALTHESYPDDPELNENARIIYGLAKTNLPAVRIDWFVNAASRPGPADKPEVAGLYHTLLQLPAKVDKLEALLGVDRFDNIRRSQLVRAGFTNSDISRQNRLVERHEGRYGAYWISYDFKSNTGTAELNRFPLGPKFKGNDFDRFAFEHAGGEIIFNLPNGLQGYLLTNAAGDRINAGPTEIVRDKSEFSGSVQVVNGLSCMACHALGMKKETVRDTIRTGTPLGGDARDKVREMYVEPKEMEKWLTQDEERFLNALERATGLFLKVGPDQDKPIGAFPEVIGFAAKRYGNNEVTLADAAYELGLRGPEDLKQRIRGSSKLREIGLGPLAADNTLKRDLWENKPGRLVPSVFQKAAVELEYGKPHSR